MTKVFLTIFYFLKVMSSFSQQVNYQPVEIGKRIPSQALDHLYKQAGKHHKFSELKKDLIILDFWNIWCTACVKSFPKLDSLQAIYNNQIQILLITNNSEYEVSKLFSKPFLKKITLPLVTDDSVFTKMFPHESVPHHVWIDRDGIVQFITYGYNTIEKNIVDYLSGKKLSLSHKSEKFNLDFSKPLWAKENESFSKKINYYSYLSKWLSECGLGGKSKFTDTMSRKIGLRVINQSILSLYKIAFGGFEEGDFRFSNRIILEVHNPQSLISPIDEENTDDWNNHNLVCYEISIPLSKRASLYKLMQDDLEKYFNYTAVIEKRKIKCLSLIRSTKNDKLRSSGKDRNVENKNNGLIIQNETLSNSLIPRLQIANSNISTPIIDRTGYTGAVDIIINSSLIDISTLRKELWRYDLDLIFEETELEMLVIRSKNTCCDIHNRY